MPQRPKTGKRLANGTITPEKSRTKQAFKDECDINRILDRAGRGASLSHLLNHSGQYGDFSDFTETTYDDMLQRISEARTIFYDLPAELRANEFQNHPGKFFEFVNNPANNDKLEELFPAMAAPGRQLPSVVEGVITPEPASPASAEPPPAAPPAPTEPTP